MITRVRVQFHVGGVSESVTPSEEVRRCPRHHLATCQNKRNIVIRHPALVMRRKAHVHSGCAVRGPRSVRKIRTRMVRSHCCKLSSLVRRPDHNWQPYMCRSYNSRRQSVTVELASLSYCRERFVHVFIPNTTAWRRKPRAMTQRQLALFSMKNIHQTHSRQRSRLGGTIRTKRII